MTILTSHGNRAWTSWSVNSEKLNGGSNTTDIALISGREVGSHWGSVHLPPGVLDAVFLKNINPVCGRRRRRRPSNGNFRATSCARTQNDLHVASRSGISVAETTMRTKSEPRANKKTAINPNRVSVTVRLQSQPTTPPSTTKKDSPYGKVSLTMGLAPEA